MPKAETRRVFEDNGIRNSAIALAAGFLGFLLWGAFAQLEEGVTASGHVVVQDNRKAVQHFEGGIIRQLNVKEGQFVAEGDILLELEPVQSEAARDEIAQELAAHSATLDRLMALRTDQPSVTFQSLQSVDVPDAIKSDITTRQAALFNQQLAALNAELSVLQTRRDALIGRQKDLDAQITATRRQLSTARDDLALRQDMLAQRLETIGNVARLEREASGYDASLSRLIGERNEAKKSDEEVLNQILEAKARFQQTISEQIVEAQSRRLSARERLQALDDRLSRTVVRAPQSGTVLNLAHSTVGGVVSPGELIMEIVPDTDELIVNVRLAPTDRDAVTAGQTVKAQLSAYKSYRMKPVMGEVMSVSADLKTDDVSGAYYYEARLMLDRSTIDPDMPVLIIPGMPVTAFIASGTKRTFLDYVFEPIINTFRDGTRMS